MRLQEKTFSRIREAIEKAELSIPEIMKLYGVSRRECDEALNLLGYSINDRAADVRAFKTIQEAKAKIGNMDEFKKDLEDMSLLNFDIMTKWGITAYTMRVVALHLGIDLSKRKSQSKSKRSDTKQVRNKTEPSWKQSSLSGDGESLKWLTKKWK